MIEAIRRRENHRRTRSKLQTNLSNAYKAFLYHEPHQRITAYTELCTTVSTFAPQLLHFLAQSDMCRIYSTDNETIPHPDTKLFTAEIDKFERVPIWGEYAPHNAKVDRHRHLAGLYFDLALSPSGFGTDSPDPATLSDAYLAADLFFNLGVQQFVNFRKSRTFKRAFKKHLSPAQIIDEEIVHDTQIASLYAVPLAAWSHLSNLPVSDAVQAIAQSAIQDYSSRIHIEKEETGLHLIPPETVNLEFLKM